MSPPKKKTPNPRDEIDLDDEAFIQAFLKGLQDLEEEAGEWRAHLPYEALVRYQEDSGLRKRYEDHLNACAYCQELMDTLCPDNGS